MYKIQNGLVPSYLSDICPPIIQDTTQYPLRNRMNTRNFTVKTSAFKNSFFPLTIHDWNDLDIDIRNSPSVISFKNQLKKKHGYFTNKLLAYGKGSGRVNHTRLRLGLSGLNEHRKRFNFVTDSHCPKCHHINESVSHFLFDCPYYATQRVQLAAGVASLIAPGVHYSLILPNSVHDKNYLVKILLNGSEDLCLNDNCKLFNIVQNYIVDTKRFV